MEEYEFTSDKFGPHKRCRACRFSRPLRTMKRGVCFSCRKKISGKS